MKKFAVAALSLLVITPTLVAQGSAVRTYEKVTPEGVFLVQEASPTDLASPDHASKNSSPDLFWNHPDGGLAWMGRSVSVGDRGTQVCSLHELNNERVQLFSVFDADPPTPIWTDTTLLGSDPVVVSSSSRGHYHVAMYWLNGKLNVHGYDSASGGTPLWTWTFSAGTADGGNLALDRDGTTVAIAVHESVAGEIHLYFLDPATGLEQFTPHFSQPFGGLRGFDLSADGSTLYVHDGSTGVDIFDVASQAVTFSTTTNGSFDGHCISGDGTKFAFGGFGSVKIWEYNGSWSSSTIGTGPGNFADEMDFSDDGLTLGFGVTQYSPAYNKVEAYMVDVPSKAVVSHATWTSSGTYQDVCSGASISNDGQYFALGHWGDDLGVNDEVYILERGSDIPVGSIDMNGSAFAVDMSADGQVTASCGKGVHANEFGSGGNVYCWDLGEEDFVVKGNPHIGQTIQLETYGTPGGIYAPYYSFGEFPDGLPTQWGTLYIDPAPQHALALILVGTWTGTSASDPVTIPLDAALVGLTVYLQYAFTPAPPGGWMLSQDYVALTFLP